VRLLPPIVDPKTPMVEWLFLDQNSYFASVEQQERAELRGRPIAIAPISGTDHTCCIAASYEAKAYGVKTGIGVGEARTLCPHIEIVEARPKLYVEYHQRILAAVNHCLPVTTVMSVDEMAFRLMGRERALANATRLAMDMKDALRRVGDTLRCSVGLAPNRYLAKLASDMLKPDGLTVLLQRDLPRALYRLKLSDLIGVGSSMERRIMRHGIHTVEQLCQLSPERMRSIWKSVLGERMWHWLRGADFNDGEPPRKSLGKQHVLAPDLRTREQAYHVVQKLLQSAAANLRKENMWAGGIGVYVEFVRSRYGDADREPVAPWKAQLRICECRDTFTLQKHFSCLWETCPKTPPLQVGVWLFNLVPDALHTMSLFDDDERQQRLSRVVDELNQRFGKSAVYFANIQSVIDAAPTRISFTSVPELGEF
jgi:DNA polymerase-4